MIEDFIKGPILPKTCIDELIYKQLDAKIANDLLTSSPIKVYATIEGTKKILVDKLPDKYIIKMLQYYFGKMEIKQLLKKQAMKNLIKD